MREKFHVMKVAAAAVLASAAYGMGGDMAQPAERRTVKVTQSAQAAFDTGLVRGLQKSPDGAGVGLDRNVLIEDDSPGAGIGQESDGTPVKNYDAVSKSVRVRKTLYVDDPAATSATLSFYARGQSKAEDAPLLVDVNGHTLKVGAFQESVPERYRRRERLAWYYLPVPIECLKAGKNEVVFYSDEESTAWRILISESRFFPSGSADPQASSPNRSARSRDGGETWEYDRLGVDDTMDGEYVVRLHLSQFRNAGVLTSPVIDLVEGDKAPYVVARGADIRSLRLDYEGKTPDGTELSMQVRSGDTFALGPEHWGGWQTVGQGATKPGGRYVQWRARFSTRDVAATPVLHNVTLRAEAEVYDVPDEQIVTVRDCRNERIVRSSYAYEYEKSDQPVLQELRRRARLDDVVKGASTEWEKVLRLKDWAAKQLARRDLTGATGFHFPDWNALDVLDGRGWFCLHHAVVFMQACQAFGIQCRHIQMNPWCYSGHEVNEVWSNEYGKWIFIDAGYNFYVVEPDRGEPMSLQEVQAVLCRNMKEDVLIDLLKAQPRVPAATETEGALPLRYVVGPSALNEKYGTADFVTKHNKYLFFMRIIPRNNFLGKKHPIPLNQGTSHWPWDGYVNWTDENTPRLPHYSQYVYKAGDMYWTLNQAEVRLIHGEKPGEITVLLDTVTPDFVGFRARIDDRDWRDVEAVFPWRLHRGLNRLAVRPRNQAGVEGVSSRFVLSWP